MVKGDRSISEYLLRIKAIVDALISIGITLQEHQDVILEGLQEDYHLLFPTIESRIESYPIAEIEALLLSRESRLELAKVKIINDAFCVNAAQSHAAASSSSSNHDPYSPASNPSHFFPCAASGSGFRSRGAFRGNRGRGRGGHFFTSGGFVSSCQICGCNGHEALNCYHRFDTSLAPRSSNSSFGYGRGPTFNFRNSPGHNYHPRPPSLRAPSPQQSAPLQLPWHITPLLLSMVKSITLPLMMDQLVL